MFKKIFIPIKENNYTPYVLKRGAVTIYALVLLIFNIATADIAALQASASVEAQSLVNLHNQERSEHNLGELKLNSKLTASAQKKAQAMMDKDCWDHYCPDGKSPWDFFDEVGYDYVYAGENLAEGFSDNDKVFTAWMNSKTHRDNILRPEFDEIGIAIVYGEFQDIENNAVIVVHFGSREIKTNVESDLTPIDNSLEEPFNIKEPNDGQILNNNTPNISGTSPDGEISISENQKVIGESIAQSGIFTFRVPTESSLNDGEHKIDATNKTTGQSDSVNFEVDTIAPVLENLSFNSMVQGSDEDEVILDITTSPDTVSLESTADGITFNKISPKSWNIVINLKVFDHIDELNIIAFDQASNKTDQNFQLSSVQGAVNQTAEGFQVEESDFNIIERIGHRRLVNSIFLIIIITLILLDYYVLANTELGINLIRTKGNYHAAIFIILLIISMAGGTAGELLEAESI